MRVLAFHSKEESKFPKLDEAGLQELQQSMAKVLENHPGVEYKDTWIDEDGYGICIWEGRSPEAVRKAIEEIVEGEYPDLIVGVKSIKG